MTYRVNQERTFKQKVTVHATDEDGKAVSGHFWAVYRVVPLPEMSSEENQDKTLLDLALVALEGLEIVNPEGHVLSGDELIAAAKADPQLASALSSTYMDALPGKSRR